MSRSIIWRLLSPIPVLAVLLAVGWVYVPKAVSDNTVEQAIVKARKSVNQFKILRG